MEVTEGRNMWRKEQTRLCTEWRRRALGNVVRGDEEGYYGHEGCAGAVPAFSVAAAMYGGSDDCEAERKAGERVTVGIPWQVVRDGARWGQKKKLRIDTCDGKREKSR